MTAINENGQFYWTFEELDLVVEYVKITKEWISQVVACSHFNNIIEKYNYGSKEYAVLKLEWDKSVDRMQYLHSVMVSFSPYLTGEEYNKAREKAYMGVLD